MTKDTRDPLPEQHPAILAAELAPFVPDTEAEAAYIAAHPLDPNAPKIPHEQVTRMVAYGRKCRDEERAKWEAALTAEWYANFAKTPRDAIKSIRERMSRPD